MNDRTGQGGGFKWLAGAMTLAATGLLYAQSSGLTRTVLERADLSAPGREVVLAKVELAPGGRAGSHTHPGEEISYVLEGEAELIVAGQAPRHLKAGDSFVIPAGVVHDAHNVGTVPARVLAMYVVEKGKPLATPAPQASAAGR
jgi:quercetin dioxygenase-like cupin family protein